MDTRVSTIQEHIQDQAMDEAKAQAKAAVDALPYFDEVKCYAKSEEKSGGPYNARKFDGVVELEPHKLLEALKIAIRERLYPRIVQVKVTELLQAVNKVQELTNELEQIKRD